MRNMEEVLERASLISSDMEMCHEAMSFIKHSDKGDTHVKVHIRTEHMLMERTFIVRDEYLLKALELSTEHYKAELEKIKSVTDMAEAALKGIGLIK